MKKYFLSIAALLMLCISAKAQFSLGIKGGFNFSKLNTDNISGNTSNITGYEFGVFGRIGKGLYVQPEIYVGTKGGQFDYSSNGTTASGTGNVRFTSLDVPVLLGQSFGLSSLNVRVMAGPIYSYILSSSVSDGLKNAYSDFGTFNNSTLGYQAGAGVDVGNVSLDLRYEGGLTKINDKYGERPNLFHLSFGFKIL
jgi:hypothetical protein